LRKFFQASFSFSKKGERGKQSQSRNIHNSRHNFAEISRVQIICENLRLCVCLGAPPLAAFIFQALRAHAAENLQPLVCVAF
jgi:hypothetical protein